MWIVISKKLARAGSQIVKQVSNFADDLGESLYEAKRAFGNDKERNNNVKSLKIAILGLPNVGKSTLINNLIGRPICAASKKIHTTRNKASAICSIDDTQLIFLDTPGLVGKGDVKKYNLEMSFLSDAENSMKEADVIGVVQDMTRIQSQQSISEKVLDLLKMARDDTNSILILNKIDTMKKKKHLLNVVRNLTSEKAWPNFSDVFMISGLTGDGVDDLRNYFLDSAKEKKWEFDKDTVTDQPPAVLIAQIVKSKLLDDLSQELPYKVQVLVEHMDCYEDNSMDVITRVKCTSNRIARLIIGKEGKRIKQIAIDAEQELCKAFQTSVRLRIEIPIDKTEKPLPTYDYEKLSPLFKKETQLQNKKF